MKTEIIVITDRSGSMNKIRQDVIGGYNTFIKEQKEVPGEAKVTYTQFDNVYEVVYAGKPLNEAPLLDTNTFVPRGGTALLDAIGRTLNAQGHRIATEKWADLVVVCIITDGEENASCEYTKERIQEMTSHAEKNGWKFVYIGANQDSFQVSKGLGMAGAISINYVADSFGTSTAYAGMSTTLRSMRTNLVPEVDKKTP